MEWGRGLALFPSSSCRSWPHRLLHIPLFLMFGKIYILSFFKCYHLAETFCTILWWRRGWLWACVVPGDSIYRLGLWRDSCIRVFWRMLFNYRSGLAPFLLLHSCLVNKCKESLGYSRWRRPQGKFSHNFLRFRKKIMFLVSSPWHCFQCQEFGFSWNFTLYREMLSAPQAEWLGGEVRPSPPASSVFHAPCS